MANKRFYHIFSTHFSSRSMYLKFVSHKHLLKLYTHFIYIFIEVITRLSHVYAKFVFVTHARYFFKL